MDTAVVKATVLFGVTIGRVTTPPLYMATYQNGSVTVENSRVSKSEVFA